MSIVLELDPELEGLVMRLAEQEGLAPERYVRRLLEREAAVYQDKTYSILELRGMGKEIWEGIDAQEYVNKLRDEWDR